MGNIRCLNCRNEITTISGMECPHCKVPLSHVKIAFLSYLGPEDSLAGYQRSYKLVLLKAIFEFIKAGRILSVSDVTEYFRRYYIERRKAGLQADRDSDTRISEAENTELHDMWMLVNVNPYAAISKHGFLKIKGVGLEGIFVLQKGIDDLSETELDSVLGLIERKLSRYYETIGSVALSTHNYAVQEVEPKEASDNIEPIEAELQMDATPVELTSPFAATDSSVEEVVIQATYEDAPGEILLEDLPLGNRAFNALKRGHISNLGQLRDAYHDGTIGAIRNIGRMVIDEIGVLLSSPFQSNVEVIRRPDETDTGVFSANISEETKALLITDIFCENTFNLFRAYCNQNNLHTIGQLVGLPHTIISNLRGFGKAKVAKVLERWAELEENTEYVTPALEERQVTDDRIIEVHESNIELPISVLQLLGGSKKVQNGLRALGIETVGKLSQFTLVALERKFKAEQMDDLLVSAESLKMPYHDLLESIYDAIAKDDSYDLFIKRALGKTLQAVADDYNLSRERVRQVCSKYVNRVYPYLAPLFAELMRENGARYIREEQIREYISSEHYASATVYVLREKDNYTSFGSPAIFFDSVSFPGIAEKLAELAADIVSDGIDFFSSIDTIEATLDAAGYGFLNADDFLDLLISLDYNFYGDYVLKDRKSYGKLCARIVEEEFPDGISNSNEDMQRLRDITQQRYGDLDLPNSNRSMFARVCDYLILRGRSKYIAPKRVYIDSDILAEIKKFIDENKQKDIFYSMLFAEFEGLLLMMTNIDNHQFLHGVLKYYYPADYVYSRDYLSKETGETGQGLADRIEEYITGVGIAVNRKDILRQFPGVSEVVLFNTVNNYIGLLQWEFNYYNTLANLKLTDGDISAIDQALSTLLEANDGYCSEGMLFEKAQSDFPQLLEKAGMKVPMNLFYTAQELFGDKYVFRNPHIARVGRFQSMVGSDIAFDLIGDRKTLSLTWFNKMAEHLKWANVSRSLIFADIEKDYIRVASDSYVRKNAFVFEEVDVSYMKALLEGQAEGNWYLPLQLFADSEEVCPNGLSVNEFLVGSVVALADFGWRIVAPQIKDRRYQRGILVQGTVDISSYDQLIATILKENGIQELAEDDLLAFLVIRSLALRYIPKDLQTSSLFQYSDGFYKVL